MPAQALVLTETPVALGSGPTTLETVVSATELGSEAVYFKVYDELEEPTAASVPVISVRFAADETRALALFYACQSNLWIAASTDHLAGLTAPSGGLEVSVVYA